MKLKNKISQNFSAAAGRYDDNAALQRQIAKHLVHIAKHHMKLDSNILDIGSGTGFIAKELGKKIIQADIAFEMCKHAAAISPVICADIESLPFPENYFDAVFSSSAMQWLKPEKAVSEIYNILKPNGVFCFSIFGPKTLGELKGLHTGINNFVKADELRAVLNGQGFEILRFREENNKLYFTRVKDLLYYMKNIGAGLSISKTEKLTKAGLQKLEHNFPEGISSTWEVFYFIAAKR